MRYVVGITMDKRARDAVSLALALARSVLSPHSVELDLVHVIRGASPKDAVSLQEREFQSLCLDEAQQWIAKIDDLIPKGIRSTTTVHFADSMAAGLLEIATARPSELIIVASASHGPLRRFTVGSVANSLLHSASIPVALAPSGYLPPSRLTRLTCALGMRTGADIALNVAIQSSVRHDVPLRLISLIGLDTKSGVPAISSARAHAKKLLLHASQKVDSATEVMVDVAHGLSIESAIDKLTWDEGEIVLIGSSRLSRSNSIFLGTTANKMLRSLPAPMIVIPRYRVRDVAEDKEISV